MPTPAFVQTIIDALAAADGRACISLLSQLQFVNDADRTAFIAHLGGILQFSDVTTTVANPGSDSKLPTERAVRAALAGVTGAAGATGAPGSVIRTGSGVPSNGTGIDGDYYLRTSNGDLYFRASGSYSVVVNLKGANGTNGTNGINGTNGVDGSPIRIVTGTLTVRTEGTSSQPASITTAGIDDFSLNDGDTVTLSIGGDSSGSITWEADNNDSLNNSENTAVSTETFSSFMTNLTGNPSPLAGLVLSGNSSIGYSMATTATGASQSVSLTVVSGGIPHSSFPLSANGTDGGAPSGTASVTLLAAESGKRYVVISALAIGDGSASALDTDVAVGTDTAGSNLTLAAASTGTTTQLPLTPVAAALATWPANAAATARTVAAGTLTPANASTGNPVSIIAVIATIAE